MSAFHFHRGDIPAGLIAGSQIGVDTETLGLDPGRDALCLVQLCCADGSVHLVQMDRPGYDCPHLSALLGARDVIKIFHFARFDMAMIKRWLGVDCAPVYCTRIASKLARTYTDRHGLKDLVREIAGKDISKVEQSSDWGADKLTASQKNYAVEDVIHLAAIRARLDQMLEREGRTDLARQCFQALPVRVALDLAGWSRHDIFAH